MNCRAGGWYHQQSLIVTQHAHITPHISRRLALTSTFLPIIQSLVCPLNSEAANPTAQDIRTDYDAFAETYDSLDSGPLAQAFGFPELRADLINQASGNVCEVGVGTGLNLPYYNTNSKIHHLTAIDISEGMLDQAQQRAATLPFTNNNSLGEREEEKDLSKQIHIDFIQDDITNVQNPKTLKLLLTFDTVIDTFSLCVYPDPLQALLTMKSLLDPNKGTLLLLEHSKSSNSLLGVYQDVTSNIVAKNGKGCVWNQDVLRLLKAAGFDVLKVQSHLSGTIISVVAKPAV